MGWWHDAEIHFLSHYVILIAGSWLLRSREFEAQTRGLRGNEIDGSPRSDFKSL